MNGLMLQRVGLITNVMALEDFEVNINFTCSIVDGYRNAISSILLVDSVNVDIVGTFTVMKPFRMNLINQNLLRKPFKPTPLEN